MYLFLIHTPHVSYMYTLYVYTLIVVYIYSLYTYAYTLCTYTNHTQTRYTYTYTLYTCYTGVVKEEDKIKRHIYLQTHLLEFNEHILLYPFSLPLNPKILCSSIIVNECKVMSSKKRPLW